MAQQTGSTKKNKSKIFVLDTNVLMHDPSSLFRFEEHDVYLPMITLEELDGHKRGLTEVARNVRQVSRDLDALSQHMLTTSSSEGFALSSTGHLKAKGRLFFQTNLPEVKLPQGLPEGKADNQILGVVQALQTQQPGRTVVLVSKDINMRIKARALGLPVEDYQNDQVLEDNDLLYTGVLELPDNFWKTQGADLESWHTSGGRTAYRIRGEVLKKLHINQYVFCDKGEFPIHAIVRGVSNTSAVIESLVDYTSKKNSILGVTARNCRQNFALNLLMDPECDFITLTGTAGTGKTLMTIAAGLAQVISADEARRYSEIIMTRVTVPMGEDIGFLPGTEEDKMAPWMGALDDNLEVISENHSAHLAVAARPTPMRLRDHIKIKSLNFMRGRTFLNKFVIVDEAQNLTPKQMKALVTRAGPGTKIVCLGNLAQIDTPYLTEGSSGLTHAVVSFKDWPHSGHVVLERGERSRLADHANDVL